MKNHNHLILLAFVVVISGIVLWYQFLPEQSEALDTIIPGKIIDSSKPITGSIDYINESPDGGGSITEESYSQLQSQSFYPALSPSYQKYLATEAESKLNPKDSYDYVSAGSDGFESFALSTEHLSDVMTVIESKVVPAVVESISEFPANF